MMRLRQILGRVAVIWVVYQLAGNTTVPVVLWMTTPAHLLECTCAVGDHASCPMHHESPPGTRCAMRASQDTGTAVLASLIGGAGILSATTSTVVQVPAVARIYFDFTTASLDPAPPDPPPPRA